MRHLGYLLVPLILFYSALGFAETTSAKTVYMVKRGDTLWRIARHYFGDPHRWRDISAYNRLRNPDLIRINERLSIPAKIQELAVSIPVEPRKTVKAETVPVAVVETAGETKEETTVYKTEEPLKPADTVPIYPEYPIAKQEAETTIVYVTAYDTASYEKLGQLENEKKFWESERERLEAEMSKSISDKTELEEKLKEVEKRLEEYSQEIQGWKAAVAKKEEEKAVKEAQKIKIARENKIMLENMEREQEKLLKEKSVLAEKLKLTENELKKISGELQSYADEEERERLRKLEIETGVAGDMTPEEKMKRMLEIGGAISLLLGAVLIGILKK